MREVNDSSVLTGGSRRAGARLGSPCMVFKKQTNANPQNAVLWFFFFLRSCVGLWIDESDLACRIRECSLKCTVQHTAVRAQAFNPRRVSVACLELVLVMLLLFSLIHTSSR